MLSHASNSPSYLIDVVASWLRVVNQKQHNK